MNTKFETVKRFGAGVSMVTIFVSILLSGHKMLVALLLTAIQAKVFHELRAVELTPFCVHLDPKQKKHDWLLFCSSMIIILLVVHNKHQQSDVYAFAFVISYSLWFVLWIREILDKNLENLNEYLLHGFWVQIATLYTATQPLIISMNIANGGMFWFLFPCSLVIWNDTMAYICGKCFGRTKLLNLSPNKTMEGFIGAAFLTVCFGYKFSAYLTRDEKDKGCCDMDFFQLHSASKEYIQFHGVVLALFASLVTPFSGYFASALKRAGRIKDFGQLIPGHGGVTDRVDCQLLMAVFTLFYFKLFVYLYD